MDHHRCYKVWIKKTRAERDTDTVFFKHKYLTNPEKTPEYKVVAAAQILTQTIKGNVTGESEEMEALEKWQTFLRRLQNKSRENKKKDTIMSIQLDSKTHQCTISKGGQKLCAKSKKKQGGRTSSKSGRKSRADCRVPKGSSL